MSQERRLIFVLMLNLAMIGGLVAVGLSSHSLGVLAAGGDYLADAGAIGFSLLAIYIGGHPNGYPKATTYAALVNVVFLLAVIALVIIEALRRLFTGTAHIEAMPVLIVSAIAAAVMILGVYILGNDADDDDFNMKSVMLDTVSDAVAAGSVALTGGVIFFLNGFYWLDSAVALAVACMIGFHALKLFGEVFVKLTSP